MKNTIFYLQILLSLIITNPSFSQNVGKDSLTIKDIIKLSVQNRP